MSIIGKAIGSVLRRVVERQARGRSWSDLARRLAESGDDLATRIRNAPDTPNDREVIQHIVGIERWGQRRLRVALGDRTLGAWLTYLDGHARREARRLAA